MLLLALVFCAATGWCVVELLAPRDYFGSLALKLSLTLPIGIGVFSLEYFCWRMISNSRATLIAVDVVVLAASLLVWSARDRREPAAYPVPIHRSAEAPRLKKVLWICFAAAVTIAIICSVRLAQAEPQGSGWDSYAIWNLHARFLFLGGTQWRNGFNTVIPWSHPDYPLLLPASIAQFWTYVRKDAEYVPAMIGLLFMYSMVGLLFFALRKLRGDSQALLAGIVLLATPFLLEQSASQYADVPLCFFVLASVVLSVYASIESNPGWIAMSGMSAAFAAWTKNEGLLFFCAFALMQALETVRKRNRHAIHSVFTFALGAAPVLLVLAWFKTSVAPPGDIFSAANPFISKITDASRYWLILRWFGKELFLFSGLPLIPVVLVGYGMLLGKRERADSHIMTSSAAPLALTLAGYFAIYVITPYDLRWHLRFSLDRLFLQLWPSALFLFFMYVRTPEEWLAKLGAMRPATTPAPIPQHATDEAA